MKCRDHNATSYSTETPSRRRKRAPEMKSRDHNATSYSTETSPCRRRRCRIPAEIITLRAIALKHDHNLSFDSDLRSRDHNATSYSTETKRSRHFRSLPQRAEIITLRAIALKRPVNTIRPRPYRRQRS